ncbi:hypothetical protein KFK09_000557 [Dendrobium nobile]|uniref:beta-galactosidase n=1 Tax=Dendrobium nobile TaxID=94219 RepID=A0A8T3C8Z9_DENNO|nr:hypothetical protein KFK09_000557 [Dendrobium nobile]
MYTQRFVSKIVQMMKDDNLYASQGGPIILSQIENEYQTIEQAFHEKGPAYVKWAANMAVNLQTGVPWMMCKQEDAPDPVYHGGTNFGKSSSSYIITAYYDQAPLDEYGLIWQPKWAHLKELHAAIKLNSEALLNGKYISFLIGQAQEAHVFKTDTEKCLAFLINRDLAHEATVQFQNSTYKLPQKSISILSNCNNVAFNTAKQLKIRRIIFGNPNNMIHVDSLAHVIHAFVNNEYVGTVHGSHGSRDAFIFNKAISLNNGQNDISLLSVMVGLPNSGAYLERRVASLQRVRISNSEEKSEDLSNNQWTYQVGLSGEKSNVFTEQGTKVTDWKTIESFPKNVVNHKHTRFDAPLGDEPLALNLIGMGKGEVWINGQSIGRYWVSFKTPKGVPSQSLYHVPRSFLKPYGNLLVLFEEMGGNPSTITLEAISVTGLVVMLELELGTGTLDVRAEGGGLGVVTLP